MSLTGPKITQLSRKTLSPSHVYYLVEAVSAFSRPRGLYSTGGASSSDYRLGPAIESGIIIQKVTQIYLTSLVSLINSAQIIKINNPK